MPYIKQERRNKLDVSIDAIIHEIKAKSLQEGSTLDGEVNYAISRIASGVLMDKPSSPVRYYDILRVVGAFNCACQEFYRRVAFLAEDNAISRNGDIEEYV